MGKAYRRQSTPELFALMGGQVPDLRGLFLRGLGGNSAELKVKQEDEIKNIRIERQWLPEMTVVDFMLAGPPFPDIGILRRQAESKLVP